MRCTLNGSADDLLVDHIDEFVRKARAAVEFVYSISQECMRDPAVVGSMEGTGIMTSE